MRPHVLTDIRSFADHDRDRAVVTRASRRAAAELLLRMDLVTSPGGLDDLTGPSAAVPPEVAREYVEFRTWFAGFVTGEMQGLVGRILQAAAVDGSGCVVVYEDRLGHRPPPAAITTMAARLQWLVDEIPSLQDAYAQLYPLEAREAIQLCASVDALDLDNDAGFERAREAWPRLEELYLLAQKGSRICRGDKEAVTAAREVLDRYAAEVAKEEEEIARLAAIASGAAPAPTEEQQRDAFAYVTQQLAEKRARQGKLEEALARVHAEIGNLSHQRDRLVARGAAA